MKRVYSACITFVVFNAAAALLASRYFFITPVVPDVLLALLLGGAVAMRAQEAT